MLLKSIEFENFRPFVGKHKLDLSKKDDASEDNIVVILGNNTHGKTTIALSFIWCLYGVSKFEESESILNAKIANEMKEGEQRTASVTVEFLNNGIFYTMKRTQTFTLVKEDKLNTNGSEAVLTYLENNETKTLGTEQSDINIAIRNILPQELSEFFFFEGEKENKIEKKDLSNAVKRLIGLEAFDNMREHLFGTQNSTKESAKSVMGYYLEKQMDESGVKAQEEYEKKVKAEEKLEEVCARLKEIDESIESFDKQIESINNRLREAAPSKEIQTRRDQVAKELKECDKTEIEKSKQFLKKFSDQSLALFVTPLLERTNSKLSEIKVSDKGIKGLEAPAIIELLERGECICGTDLSEGTVAYKNVKDYLEFIPPKDVGSLVREIKEKNEDYSRQNMSFIEEMENIYNEILDSRSKRDALEVEEKELLLRISEIGEVDVEEDQNNILVLKEKISDLYEEKEKKNEEKTLLNAEIETATNNFNMYKQKSEKCKKYQVYYEYAKAMYTWIQDTYADKEKEIKDKLSNNIELLFNNMYSGSRQVVINDRYQIEVLHNGEKLAMTGGLHAIEYFSYVGGLVKTAQEVMEEYSDDERISGLGGEYPLVLDAAFSHTDETHTKNITKELSSVANQIVFAVMEKDWQYAKGELDGKVSRTYELIKHDEHEIEFKEV